MNEEEVRWLKRGCQRAAVARALYKPLTVTRIMERARAMAHRIQLRDIWFLLRQLGEKDLTYCLNPAQPTGKLYFLTAKGRDAIASAFSQAIKPLPERVDWNRYSLVVRASVRRLVLEELVRQRLDGARGKTATEIRKSLLARHPTALNATLRALADLRNLRLIRRIDGTRARSKRYVLTPMGRRIVEEMQR